MIYIRYYLNIRYYPILSSIQSRIKYRVSFIRYKMISGIIWYPVTGIKKNPVLFGTLTTATKHCHHRFLRYLIFLVS